MDWSIVQFCPEVQGMRDKISQFIAQDVFQSQSETLKSILKARYAQMGKGCKEGWAYDRDEWNLKQGDVTYLNLSTARKRDVRLLIPNNSVNTSEELQSLFDNEDVGHDLPVWLYKGEKCPSSNVMIIAQDPKRKEGQDNSVYNQAGRRGVILSSPWALCSRDFRANRKNAWIVSLVEALLEGARMVYITDNNKFYAREPNYVRRQFNKLYNAFRDLVREEIRCERPEFIITIGDDAIKTLLPCLEKKRDWRITNYCPYYKGTYYLNDEKESCGIPVYAFVHPGNIRYSPSYADLLRSNGLDPKFYIANAIRQILNGA